MLRERTARRTLRVVLALSVLSVMPVVAVANGASPLDDATALRTSQAAIGRQLAGYRLTATDGSVVTFERLRGRPVVLSLVYTSCYYVCSSLTVHLRDTVKIARSALGTDRFTVLTIGFDTPNDTPERMRQYAHARGADLPGWIFASADAATLQRLVGDVGFSYVPSPKGFDHVTQTTLIDASGSVVLQVYGDSFAPPALVEPLKKLVWGAPVERSTLTSLLDRVRLVCTIYDPTSGRYRFDYSLIVEIVAGSLALGMAAVGILAARRNVR